MQKRKTQRSKAWEKMLGRIRTWFQLSGHKSWKAIFKHYGLIPHFSADPLLNARQFWDKKYNAWRVYVPCAIARVHAHR